MPDCSKALLQSQVDELKKQLDQEVKGKQVVSGSLSLVLEEKLEEEQEGKQEFQRLMSRFNNYVVQWHRERDGHLHCEIQYGSLGAEAPLSLKPCDSSGWNFRILKLSLVQYLMGFRVFFSSQVQWQLH